MMIRINVFDIEVETIPDHELTALRAKLENEAARRSPPVIDLTLEEKCLIRCGEFIAAIKSVRERFSPKPSLRHAKDACDAYKATLTPEELLCRK